MTFRPPWVCAALVIASASIALAEEHQMGIPFSAGREASVQSDLKCTETTPCQNWGTCDVFSGHCTCPPGYGGRLCDEVFYPACRHSDKPGPNGEPPIMSCTFVGPQACECFRQCHRRPDYVDQDFRGPCFERSAPIDSQLSDFPDESEKGVKYFDDYMRKPNEITRAEMVRSYQKTQAVASPSKCPDRCFGNGYCLASGVCDCHRGFKGENCGVVEPYACMNSCSGHGQCLHGFCSCEHGWFGLDCGYNLFTNVTKRLAFTAEVDTPLDGEKISVVEAMAEAPIKREPDFTRLRVYIHELPPWMNLVQWGEYLVDRTDETPSTAGGIYRVWRSFLELLLKDWAIRTLDPDEANLFYVPAFTFSYTDNGGNPAKHVQKIVDFLKAEHPKIWERHGGRDHIFVTVGDQGMCPFQIEEQKAYLWMSLYGLKYERNAHPQRNVPGATCFDPLGMVVLTPDVGSTWLKRSQATWPDLYPQAAAEAPASLVAPAPPRRVKKDTLLFFAGSVGETASHTADYSLGVRQRMFRLYGGKNISGFVLAVRIPDSEGWMRRSTFCLAPAGFGWGTRLEEAITAGCIPVIAQDGVFLPGHDVLPYEEFSVTLRYEDLDNLPAILGSFSQEDIESLQAGLKKWHRHFLWASEGGFAYNVAIESLRKKLYNLQSRYSESR